MIASIVLDKSLVCNIPIHILRRNVALAESRVNVAQREYDTTEGADFTVQMLAFDKLAVARADLKAAKAALEARYVA